MLFMDDDLLMTYYSFSIVMYFAEFYFLIISVMLEFNLGKHCYTCFTDEKLKEG